MTKEVSLLRLLSHQNIVKYYQSDLSEDMRSIDVLLEYVPGGSLRSILEKYGALELSVIKNYSCQLLKGLKYLHDHKIIHRDLKSGNILITSDGVLKVSDLGSSKKFEEFDEGITKSLKGSPYWMAPEVIKRQGHGISADIWSLGCVLIEMVTGRPPWSNYTNDTHKVLMMIAKDESYPDIPQTNDLLLEVIYKCLKREPTLRPTCDELLTMDFFNWEIDFM
jgi:serine/threonine protein kinase